MDIMDAINYKFSPIGPVPKDWKVVKLKDVTLKVTSLNASRLSEFYYVDISSIDNQTFRIINWVHFKGSKAPSRARRLIRKDDVLFATTRPYLKNIAIVPPELDGQICSTGFCVIRANRSIIEPLWIFYCVQTNKFVEKISAKMKGATYPAVTDTDVLMEKIPLPPLPEQKRLAEILRTVDEGIEKVEQEIEHTERLKKGLMQRLLTRGIGHKEFKDSPIGKIPNEWEVVKLQDVTLKAKSLDASTLSEFDYVDISSIDNQIFKITNWARLKGKQAPSRARRLIRKGDILFATTRPYLKNIAIVPLELDCLLYTSPSPRD